MKSKRHLLIALTQPTEGKEDEFNAWYDEFHLPECLRVPGFKSAQRFKLTATRNDEPPEAYLALYELEGEDPQKLLDDLHATRDERTKSDAIDSDNVSLWVFSPVAEAQEAEND